MCRLTFLILFNFYQKTLPMTSDFIDQWDDEEEINPYDELVLQLEVLKARLSDLERKVNIFSEEVQRHESDVSDFGDDLRQLPF
jgi:predicted nuclease with TOPRIM domain